jgi:ribonucleotide reductase alpha subunit
MSNNSVMVNVGTDFSKIVDGIILNGEPGVIWEDVSKAYGRLGDPINNKDHRIMGYNPCAEQSLESYEMCTLVETYLNRHESKEDYLRTLKFAYLYAKTVTLLPTHWEETVVLELQCLVLLTLLTARVSQNFVLGWTRATQ